MTVGATTAPISVYMLAEHLDAMLAAGEDLMSRGHDWSTLAAQSGNTPEFASEQRKIAEDVRGFELILMARALKARDHASAVAALDKRFAPVAQLFASGTAVLLDAVSECGDARGEDFETGDAVVAYVRSRGLIAKDAAGVLSSAQLNVDATFMVAKRIALGPLLDMAAAFLDALDTQYELFNDDVLAEPERPAATPRIEFGRRERVPLN